MKMTGAGKYSHAPFLPVVREWPCWVKDYADVRNPKLLREQMRFCSPNDGKLEKRVELGLDFGLERQDGGDDISAVRFDYQRHLSLRSAPVRQLELSLMHAQVIK